MKDNFKKNKKTSLSLANNYFPLCTCCSRKKKVNLEDLLLQIEELLHAMLNRIRWNNKTFTYLLRISSCQKLSMHYLPPSCGLKKRFCCFCCLFNFYSIVTFFNKKNRRHPQMTNKTKAKVVVGSGLLRSFRVSQESKATIITINKKKRLKSGKQVTHQHFLSSFLSQDKERFYLAPFPPSFSDVTTNSFIAEKYI